MKIWIWSTLVKMFNVQYYLKQGALREEKLIFPRYVLLQAECAVSDQQGKNNLFEWDLRGVLKNMQH